MGNQNSSIVQKINFEDVQYAIKRKDLIINTLPSDEQSILIIGTVNIERESEMFNTFIKNGEYDKQIIVYGKNSNDPTIFKRYEQLISLGFNKVFVYTGGLFEWMLLQDIYGDDMFPTTKKILDILLFKPSKILNVKYITNSET
jgi:hypothetical protein